MGGQILEYEAKTILREGIRQGEQKGRCEGRIELGAEVLKLIHEGKLKEAEQRLADPNRDLPE